MEARAQLRKYRVSPRKVRLVADMIRGLPVYRAFDCLQHTPKQAGLALYKLLRSATANLQRKVGKPVPTNTVYIKHVYVGSAGMLKRIKPAPQGRAHRIRKRSSHVTLVLQDRTARPPERPPKTETKKTS